VCAPALWVNATLSLLLQLMPTLEVLVLMLEVLVLEVLMLEVLPITSSTSTSSTGGEFLLSN